MAKRESQQFGRVLPIQNKAHTEIYGVKIFPFKEEGGGLDFTQGILIWKRDVEDVLSGRIRQASVFVDEPLPPLEAAPKVVGSKR